jgi:hypothetical protein
MLNFVAAWRGNAVAAARAAGYKNPKASAEKLMKNPTMQDAIRKRQEFLIEETTKRFAADIEFCRADVLNRIWRLANPPEQPKNGKEGPSFETQLKAAQLLAEIFNANIAQAAAIAPKLVGKSPAELELFLATGTVPGSGE